MGDTPAGDNSPHVELPSSKHCTFRELPVYENEKDPRTEKENGMWQCLGVGTKAISLGQQSRQLVFFIPLTLVIPQVE